MVVPIGLTDGALATHSDLGDGLHEVAPDVAYLRAILVNVVFLELPQAGGHGRVLVDTGVIGTKSAIVRAAATRLGLFARPAAIIQTHGHFDHIGALEELSAEWDAPIYAHPAEFPFLTGQSSYPPPDTAAAGGIMPKLSPLFPRSPFNVSSRLMALPHGGEVPTLPGWSCVHILGHTSGHVSLWRERDRTVVAGDAIITTGQESAYEVAVEKLEMHGLPRYFTPDWEAARRSVKKLASLNPHLIITGHGRAAAGAEMQSPLVKLSDEFGSIAVPKHLR